MRRPLCETLWITMNIDEYIRNTYQLMNILNEKMDGLELPVSLAARVSGALLHLSLEHFCSIIILISNRLNGSAASLIRLQYEALIRGMFFYHCASEEDASNFTSGAEPPKIKQMIERLEEIPELASGVLSKVHGREWREMNSYTHGGTAQVYRRFSGSDLISNYSEKDRFDILRASRYMAFMAAIHTAIACGNIELAEHFKSEYEKSSDGER